MTRVGFEWKHTLTSLIISSLLCLLSLICACSLLWYHLSVVVVNKYNSHRADASMAKVKIELTLPAFQMKDTEAARRAKRKKTKRKRKMKYAQMRRIKKGFSSRSGKDALGRSSSHGTASKKKRRSQQRSVFGSERKQAAEDMDSSSRLQSSQASTSHMSEKSSSEMHKKAIDIKSGSFHPVVSGLVNISTDDDGDDVLMNMERRSKDGRSRPKLVDDFSGTSIIRMKSPDKLEESRRIEERLRRQKVSEQKLCTVMADVSFMNFALSGSQRPVTIFLILNVAICFYAFMTSTATLWSTLKLSRNGDSNARTSQLFDKMSDLHSSPFFCGFNLGRTWFGQSRDFFWGMGCLLNWYVLWLLKAVHRYYCFFFVIQVGLQSMKSRGKSRRSANGSSALHKTFDGTTLLPAIKYLLLIAFAGDLLVNVAFALLLSPWPRFCFASTLQRVLLVVFDVLLMDCIPQFLVTRAFATALYQHISMISHKRMTKRIQLEKNEKDNESVDLRKGTTQMASLQTHTGAFLIMDLEDEDLADDEKVDDEHKYQDKDDAGGSGLVVARLSGGAVTPVSQATAKNTTAITTNIGSALPLELPRKQDTVSFTEMQTPEPKALSSSLPPTGKRPQVADAKSETTTKGKSDGSVVEEDIVSAFAESQGVVVADFSKVVAVTGLTKGTSISSDLNGDVSVSSPLRDVEEIDFPGFEQFDLDNAEVGDKADDAGGGAAVGGHCEMSHKLSDELDSSLATAGDGVSVRNTATATLTVSSEIRITETLSVDDGDGLCTLRPVPSASSALSRPMPAARRIRPGIGGGGKKRMKRSELLTIGGGKEEETKAEKESSRSRKDVEDLQKRREFIENESRNSRPHRMCLECCHCYYIACSVSMDARMLSSSAVFFGALTSAYIHLLKRCIATCVAYVTISMILAMAHVFLLPFMSTFALHSLTATTLSFLVLCLSKKYHTAYTALFGWFHERIVLDVY